MEIINRKVSELIPYDRNPRKNDEAVKYVKASIEQFGFKVPIVIDAQGVIVAGHTRLLAAKQLGLKEVPCIIADDLSEEQVKAFRLADNKTAEMSMWDDGLLKLELDEIIDIDMSEFGFIDFEPSRDAIEDGEPDNNEKAEVYVRITFKHAQHFRQHEDGLRSLVDSFEDVKISVGGEDEDKQSDL